MKGNDNVVAYIYYGNKGSVVQMYNAGKKTPHLLAQNQPSIGLVNSTLSFVNKILMCTFSRLNSNPNVTNYFNLNNRSYYLLVAAGAAHSAHSIKHHCFKDASRTAFDFKSSVGG